MATQVRVCFPPAEIPAAIAIKKRMTNNRRRLRMPQEAYVEITHREIASRACQLWRAAGCPRSGTLAFWFQAEAEMLTAIMRSIQTTPIPAPILRSLWPNTDRWHEGSQTQH
jgi:hypothetical protein